MVRFTESGIQTTRKLIGDPEALVVELLAECEYGGGFGGGDPK